jgi:uncharacterized LabA/DUF88 family protein
MTCPRDAPLSVNDSKKKRIRSFVDGFNLYHALDWFEDGVNEDECRRYRKYKWLSLTSLSKCYISPNSQELVGVEYFTTYATWNPMKYLRHRQYVMAQEAEGVHVTFGNFKDKYVQCQAACAGTFLLHQEKQTDVNIALSLVEHARTDSYDIALLISGDSDLIPAIQLVHKLGKKVAAVVPLGRKAKEVQKACQKPWFKMTEEHLERCLLPDLLKHPSGAWVVRPAEYNPDAQADS